MHEIRCLHIAEIYAKKLLNHAVTGDINFACALYAMLRKSAQAAQIGGAGNSKQDGSGKGRRAKGRVIDEAFGFEPSCATGASLMALAMVAVSPQALAQT